jgi:hypothetical protein
MRIFMVVLLFLSITQGAWGATFRGKVVDADTKQPIEGAVVVASWNEERATPAGPTSRLKDVKEALTDKNGMWIIDGPKGGNVGDIKAIFSFITGTYFTNSPEFIIFKPGYCSWPVGFGIDTCKGKIQPAGSDKVAEGITVELPRLTNRERMTMIRNIPSLGIAEEAKDRLPLFMKSVTQEEKKIPLR